MLMLDIERPSGGPHDPETDFYFSYNYLITVNTVSVVLTDCIEKDIMHMQYAREWRSNSQTKYIYVEDLNIFSNF